MALKKPSEYFSKEKVTLDNSVQKLSNVSELSTFSDAFESFKNNLNKIEILSEFSETLDNYRINIEKVNHLSEKIEDVQSEIKSLLTKEDLDRAMMSQLFVVEQSMLDVQNKVKGINEKNLTNIRLEISSLTNNVSEFLDVEVPKYKKLIVDSELRSSNRYDELEETVNKTLEGIGEFVETKYDELTETLTGINESSLSGILQDFKNLENTIFEFKEEEIPKYKGFIVETERKVELNIDKVNEKLEKLNENVDDKFNEIEEKYSDLEKNSVKIETFDNLETDILNLKNNEIPKYREFIVKNEKKLEEKINQFQTKLDESIFNILEKVSLIEGDKTNLVDVVNGKIKSIKNLGEIVSKQLVTNEDYRKHLTKKVSELEMQIIRNESHIKVQNKELKQIEENFRSSIDNLNFDHIEEKNYELLKKVKYLEEIFEKFNEKEFLNKNEILLETTLAEPSSIKNSDPLTPLDQKYVTLEQLQEHYRLFINRIQQQLSTIGGGGETRLKYLDDIVGIATNPSAYNNKYLKYDHNIQKFIFSDIDSSSISSNTLVNLNDVDDSNLSGISTDYLMVYDPTISGFKFVNPKTYFGINSDFNIDPQIDDFGSY